MGPHSAGAMTAFSLLASRYLRRDPDDKPRWMLRFLASPYTGTVQHMARNVINAAGGPETRICTMRLLPFYRIDVLFFEGISP
jgi:hypothetical protein